MTLGTPCPPPARKPVAEWQASISHLDAFGERLLCPDLQVVVGDCVLDRPDAAFPTCGVGGDEEFIVAAALIAGEIGSLGAVAGEG